MRIEPPGLIQNPPITISGELAANDKITWVQKIVISILDNFRAKNGDDEPFPIMSLYARLGIDKTTLIRSVQDLKEMKILVEDLKENQVANRHLKVAFRHLSGYVRSKDLRSKDLDLIFHTKPVLVPVLGGVLGGGTINGTLSTKRHLLLDKVMAIPGITHHTPGSKAYQRASQDLQSLQDGTRFAKGGIVTVKLDPAWMTKFQIPSVFPHKAWADMEILESFVEISKWLYSLQPDVKKAMPKDVPTLIYNPRSGKSLFLKMACTKAEEATGIKPKNPEKFKFTVTNKDEVFYYDRLSDLVKKCRATSEIPPNESKHLLDIAVKLVALQKKTRGKVPEAIPVHLLDEYCDYVWDNQRADGKLSVYQIGPGTKDWDTFWRTRGYDEFK
jgi:hypothetical protein